VKRVLVLVLAMSVAVTASAAIGAKVDDASVPQAVRDHLEGWFSTHPDPGFRAVYLNLFKSLVRKVPRSSEEYAHVTTAGSLVSWARHNGPRVKDRDGFQGMGVLYQDNLIAVVRAQLDGIYDVCMLVKRNGEWKILAALWDVKT